MYLENGNALKRLQCRISQGKEKDNTTVVITRWVFTKYFKYHPLAGGEPLNVFLIGLAIAGHEFTMKVMMLNFKSSASAWIFPRPWEDPEQCAQAHLFLQSLKKKYLFYGGLSKLDNLQPSQNLDLPLA